ncbi:hypothetical protein JZ751_020488, partial [Albula glossodonta]
MATFVVDEVFVQVDRSFLVENMGFLRGFCYSNNKRKLMADILQEKVTFGPVEQWTSDTLDQVDRFIFFLPKATMKKIPAELMTLERIERLFLSQQQWETGEFGALCLQGRDEMEQSLVFDKQKFLLQYFLGFLTVGQKSQTPAVLAPSCESLHATQPSAWPIYGPASAFSPSVISQLGYMASLLTEAELKVLKLTEVSAVAALGSISTWTNRQLSVLFLSVLNSTKRNPSQLESSTLVALGHIICGITVADMRHLNAVEFSKAVLWLGRLKLSCSEVQLEALVELLSHSLAFGPISSWGTEVFIEIGALAAGLPDMAMSALVQDQIEGITPLAISLIPSDKFAVVFHHSQIRMFSYEQAVAVTADQRSALTPVQQTALSMVLTPWENKPVDFR